MLIKSFKIDHKKLIPGIYLHEVKKIDNYFITTYDIRFKKPNTDFISMSAIHSLEHIMATFFTQTCPEKIYFGPMGCQTGFYYVVGGKKDLNWLLKQLPKLNKYIMNLKEVPGKSPLSCGHYKNLSITNAKEEWKKFYSLKRKWGKEYKVLDEIK